MRNTFINEIYSAAQTDPNIFLVVGDLGYSVVDQFAKELPKQYLNAGVAEQNMTGLAAGLALASERTVFTYSIANFPTLRCFEQIRNDVCYHNANVKIVSVGCGLAYGAQGYTHYGIEDAGVMRTLPNIVIASPGDPLEAKALAHLALQANGPWYIRLGKNKEPQIHASLPKLKIGEPVLIRKGSDGLILASGPILSEAAKAAEILLAQKNLNVTVVSVPFLKPIREQALIDLMKTHPWTLTVEENSRIGGLGSAVSEIIAGSGSAVLFQHVCLPDKLDKLGDQEFLRSLYGIDAKAIVERINAFRTR